MKIYEFCGTYTSLVDDAGEILLNQPGQKIEADPSRVEHLVASGLLKEVNEKETNDGSIRQ